MGVIPSQNHYYTKEHKRLLYICRKHLNDFQNFPTDMFYDQIIGNVKKIKLLEIGQSTVGQNSSSGVKDNSANS